MDAGKAHATGETSKRASAYGIIDNAAAIAGENPSTSAAHTDAMDDALTWTERRRSDSIARLNPRSRLPRSACSACSAPERPEMAIAKLAPNPAPSTNLGSAGPEAFAPRIMPSMVIAPSKELMTKYLREMSATPAIRRYSLNRMMRESN